MRMRWTVYAGVSAALAGGVIVKALAQRPNFYSATVYLAQSSANLMILTNLILVVACSLLVGLQKLLYGPLRPVEIESLYEKAWFAVTETCLAMTIFRGEVDGWFLLMFFSLLAGKVWGWIGEGRVEILEQQPPNNPRLFHTRLVTSLIISVLFDSTILEYIVKQVVGQARPDMMVMFGFEFAVLTILSLSTLTRYVINLVEILIIRRQKEKRIEEIRKERRRVIEEEQRAAGVQPTAAEELPGAAQSDAQAQPPTLVASTTSPHPDEPIDDAELEVEGWEEKGRWMFYLDLTTDFFKLVVYLSFFFILLVFYGLPIHIMRDVFLTCRSFFKRIADFVRYRTATRDMNERYPDATAEEIGAGDVCIICREDMTPLPLRAPNIAGAPPPPPNPVADRMRPKKLPCGHILHFSCLRSWLERQQICPTCRRPVVSTEQTRVVGLNGGAAQAIAGQPGVVGQQAQQQGQDPHVQPGEPQNRARIYQLGPLRIGIGAGRGNMFEDLAQRIHDPNARPGDNVVQNGQQHYGFGFGIGRTPRQQPPRSPTRSIQSRIDRLTQQIEQEIRDLHVATQQLGTLRLLQAELTRLRNLQPNVNPSQIPGGIAVGPPASQDLRPPQAFIADNQRRVLEAGSDQLPEGLTLPQGWTMMPLQRLNGQHRQTHAPVQVPIPMFSPTQIASAAPQFGDGQHAINANGQHIQTPIPAGLPFSWTPPAPQHAQPPPARTEGTPIAAPAVQAAVIPGANATLESMAPASALTQNAGAEFPSTLPSGTNGEAGTVPSASTPLLPFWGSLPPTTGPSAPPHDANGHSNDNLIIGASETLENVNTSGGAARPGEDLSSQSAEIGNTARTATVEDFIEDPD